MTRQHDTPERRANHRAGQEKIKRTCKCGRKIVGNAGWYSHLSARREGCTDFELYFGRSS